MVVSFVSSVCTGSKAAIANIGGIERYKGIGNSGSICRHQAHRPGRYGSKKYEAVTRENINQVEGLRVRFCLNHQMGRTRMI